MTNMIHILNLEPGDISDENFVFAVSSNHANPNVKKAITVMMIVIPIGVLLIVGFFVYRIMHWAAKKAAKEVLPNKLVMIIDTTLDGEYVLDENLRDVHRQHQQQTSHFDVNELEDIENNLQTRWSEKLSVSTSFKAGSSSGVGSVEVSSETVSVPPDFEVVIDDAEESESDKVSDIDSREFGRQKDRDDESEASLNLSDRTYDNDDDTVDSRPGLNDSPDSSLKVPSDFSIEDD